MLRILRTPVGVAAALVMAAMVVGPHVADACAGLIGSNGAVNLGRTTTLAAYHDGVEHYVTAFEFQGGGGEFGTLIPLPGVPTNVERGGAWTLQRLRARDAAAGRAGFAGDSALAPAARRRRGAAAGAHRRARHHRAQGRRRRTSRRGRRSTASASRRTRRRCSTSTRSAARSSSRRSSTATPPQRAASRSATARPSTSRSRRRTRGCRCASSALGKQPDDRVDADVFLLTDEQPALLPAPQRRPCADAQRAGDDARCSTTCAPTTAWAGCRSPAWLTKLRIDSAGGGPELRPGGRRQRRGQPVAGRRRAGSCRHRAGSDADTPAFVGRCWLGGASCSRSLCGRRCAAAPAATRDEASLPRLLCLVIGAVAVALLAAAAARRERRRPTRRSRSTTRTLSLSEITATAGEPIDDHAAQRRPDRARVDRRHGREVHERHRTGTEPYHDADPDRGDDPGALDDA